MRRSHQDSPPDRVRDDQAPEDELERARLLCLDNYDLDFETPEAEFDHIVRLTARLFKTPVSLISIIDADKQNFKAKVGMDICNTARDISFCTHVVSSHEPLVVENALTHPDFSENPLVTDDPNIRFYAGAPLTVPSGHTLGSLCIIDYKPRKFSKEEQQLLIDLAALVVDRIELRRTERKRKGNERRLFRLAHFDPLTGLANRYHFRAGARKLLKPDDDNVVSGALAIFDIDRFRDINGLFGNTVGDEILKAVSERLQSQFTDALWSKFGDDEFAILIPGLSDPLAFYGRLQELTDYLRSGVPVGKRCISIDVSMGYAIAPSHGQAIGPLIANATLALRNAKNDRSGKIKGFRDDLRHAVERHQLMETELHRAAEEDEFELFYQPQVDLLDKRIIGAEALLRWRHPVHGLLQPSQFLPTLEKMTLSLQVGTQSLRSAINQAARWNRAGTPIRVSVNLFAAQFLSGELISTIKQELDRNELPPQLLEIELLESVAVDSGRAVIDALKALSNIGVSVALDDFGTGYSSLTSLKRVPANRLKIDRQFVTGARENSEDAAVVEALIGFGKRLGISVTAEGIETKLEEQWLRAAGCHEVQGYLYGRPMPADDLTAMLSDTAPSRHSA